MVLKNLYLIGYLIVFLWGADDCPENSVEIDDVCYYKKHLDVLQDFIDENIICTNLKRLPISLERLKVL